MLLQRCDVYSMGLGVPTSGGVEPLSILLVEDEYLIAIDAEEMLHALGAAKVTIASTFEVAENCLLTEPFDLAILDVNLNGRLSFPLADIAAKRGSAVLFCTGYNLITRPIAGYESGICIAKPYSVQALKAGVEAALTTARTTPQPAAPSSAASAAPSAQSSAAQSSADLAD